MGGLPNMPNMSGMGGFGGGFPGMPTAQQPAMVPTQQPLISQPKNQEFVDTKELVLFEQAKIPIVFGKLKEFTKVRIYFHSIFIEILTHQKKKTGCWHKFGRIRRQIIE